MKIATRPVSNQTETPMTQQTRAGKPTTPGHAISVAA